MSQYKGPDRKTLKHLSQLMQSMGEGIGQGTIGGKGKKVVQEKFPTKCCPVCCAVYDYKVGDESTLSPVNCERCQGMLDQGYIGFTCGDQFAFAKSDRLQDMAGKVIKLSPHVFKKLSDTFAMEWKTDNDKPPQSPG